MTHSDQSFRHTGPGCLLQVIFLLLKNVSVLYQRGGKLNHGSGAGLRAIWANYPPKTWDIHTLKMVVTTSLSTNEIHADQIFMCPTHGNSNSCASKLLFASTPFTAVLVALACLDLICARGFWHWFSFIVFSVGKVRRANKRSRTFFSRTVPHSFHVWSSTM